MKLDKDEPYRPQQFVWIALPAGMFAATGLLMTIIGTEQLSNFISVMNAEGLSALSQFKGRPEHSYFVWSTIILRVIMGVEMFYMLVYVFVTIVRKGYSFGLYRDFLTKGGRIDVLFFQLMPAAGIAIIYAFKLFLLKDYLDDHLGLTAILSILTTVFAFSMCYFNMFSSKGSVSLKECVSLMRYNYDPKDRHQFEEDMIGEIVSSADAEEKRRIRARVGVTAEVEAWEKGKVGFISVASSIFSVVAEDSSSLMGRFQRLMQNEQLYLQPGLSLDDVADRLESNKTYVSKMVNSSYNMGFPELLNILRVDYAQHYILLHKDAKQDTIARECGFFSASSFNTVFKKVTGMTPKVWIASYEKNQISEQL